MPTTRSIRPTDDPAPTKGASLARGPAWIVGTILAVFGLILFFEVSGTPLDTGGFPDGAAVGDRFIGFEANAWTAWLTTAAGVAVLIGAAQHASAKLTSLLIGLALGAAAVIALFDGNDVLGLAAANGLTALGWGIAAAILIVTALLPRLGGRSRGAREDRRAEAVRRREDAPVAGHETALRDDQAFRDRAGVATRPGGSHDPDGPDLVSREHRTMDGYRADDHARVTEDGSEDATRVHSGSEDATRVHDDGSRDATRVRDDA